MPSLPFLLGDARNLLNAPLLKNSGHPMTAFFLLIREISDVQHSVSRILIQKPPSNTAVHFGQYAELTSCCRISQFHNMTEKIHTKLSPPILWPALKLFNFIKYIELNTPFKKPKGSALRQTANVRLSAVDKSNYNTRAMSPTLTTSLLDTGHNVTSIYRLETVFTHEQIRVKDRSASSSSHQAWPTPVSTELSRQ